MINGRASAVACSERTNTDVYPTAAYIEEDGRIVTGYAAEQRRGQDPVRFFERFKGGIHQEAGPHPDYPGIGWVDLVAAVLGQMKADAEQLNGGQAFRRAVLTVPAMYLESDPRREVMRQAGLRAGFEEVALLREPEAAAVYYNALTAEGEQIAEGEIAMVYDLGGGTFDPALIRRTAEGYEFLGTGSDDGFGIECGGVFFDQRIVEEFIRQCSQVVPAPDGAQDAEARVRALRHWRRIRQFCRNVKHHLSKHEAFDGLDPILEEHRFRLTRSAFNELIAGSLDETLACCSALVARAGIGWDRIGRILMVGGSCYVPLVREKLEAHARANGAAAPTPCWGQVGEQYLNPTHAVCLGAAVWGSATKVAPHPFPDLDRQAASLCEKAATLLEEHKYDEALEHVQIAIELEPSRPEPILLKAKILYAQEKYKLAVASATAALRLKRLPKGLHATALAGRGMSHYQLGNYQEAVADLEQASSEDPSLQSFVILAAAHFALGLGLWKQAGDGRGHDLHPASAREARSGACPKCGFSYRWDGSACDHCGYVCRGSAEDGPTDTNGTDRGRSTLTIDRPRIKSAAECLRKAFELHCGSDPWSVSALRFSESHCWTLLGEHGCARDALISAEQAYLTTKSGEGFNAAFKQLAHLFGCEPSSASMVEVRRRLWDSIRSIHEECSRPAVAEYLDHVKSIPDVVWESKNSGNFCLHVASVLSERQDGDADTICQWLDRQFKLHPYTTFLQVLKDPFISAHGGQKVKILLMPMVVYEESHGAVFNYVTIRNASPFAVHDVQAVIKVQKKPGCGYSETLTRKVNRLGRGESKRWDSVFQTPGFLGGNIASVEIDVSCAETEQWNRAYEDSG